MRWKSQDVNRTVPSPPSYGMIPFEQVALTDDELTNRDDEIEEMGVPCAHIARPVS